MSCKQGNQLRMNWYHSTQVVDVTSEPGRWSQMEIRDACNTENANAPDYLDTFAAYKQHVRECEECGL